MHHDSGHRLANAATGQIGEVRLKIGIKTDNAKRLVLRTVLQELFRGLASLIQRDLRFPGAVLGLATSRPPLKANRDCAPHRMYGVAHDDSSVLLEGLDASRLVRRGSARWLAA
jgi:hypothetical protein